MIHPEKIPSSLALDSTAPLLYKRMKLAPIYSQGNLLSRYTLLFPWPVSFSSFQQTTWVWKLTWRFITSFPHFLQDFVLPKTLLSLLKKFPSLMNLFKWAFKRNFSCPNLWKCVTEIISIVLEHWTTFLQLLNFSKFKCGFGYIHV